MAVAGFLTLALWALAPAPAANANRFGPPWPSEVIVDQTVVYSQPSKSAPAVGPLSRGAIVVVVAELKGSDGAGTDWTAIPDGFVPSSDVAEKRDSWLAEVSRPSVSVYAKPDAASPIRRTAAEGALLRVTGVSPGMDGDTGTWWGTTEGYVLLGGLRWATNDWAAWWQLPSPDEAINGWWGELRGAANVRAAPTTQSPIVGSFAGGERVKVLTEEEGESVGGNATWFRIDGGRFAGARVHSSLVRRLPDPIPNTTPPEQISGTWIAVDRSTSTLTLVQDGQAPFATYVALGKAGRETPAGRYATFGKFRADDMTSTSVPDAEYSYDLPNVPFTQYYLDGGYAIHGTYWHDQFGSQESQGCVNLTWTDAAYLFGVTRPELPPNQNEKWLPPEQATPVFIRD